MSRLRVAYTAGDAIDPELLMYFRSIGVNLKQLYGSTETGFFVAMQRDGQVRPNRVGQAAHGVELKITPQREILVRSPGLFKEYHLDPETTTRAKNAEGWFHTGDLGYLDSDGHLRVLDRASSMGALNDGSLVAPRLLESKLKVQPYIREAVAFGHDRDRVCVLVDIDTAAVGQWADKGSLSYTGHADLASLDEVHGLIGNCIAKVNAELAADATLANSQIHRFLILRKDLDADDGVLTRTGKVRRAVVAERCRPLVEAMYEGRASVRDEAAGDTADEIRIRDVKVFAGADFERAL
jgi:long-chain acyl-CoA synthetase